MGIPPLPPMPQGPTFMRQPGQVIQGPGLPFRQPASGQIIDGLRSFVQNFVGMKTQAQEMYKQTFYEGLQQKMAGIPTNDDELARYAKKAGLPIRTNPYSDEEKAWMRAKSSNPQMQPLSNDPGALVASQQANAATGGSAWPQPPPPQAPQQSMLQRLAQTVLGPRTTPGMGQPGTPMGNFLSQVGQASQQAGSTLPGQISQQGRVSALKELADRLGVDSSKINVQNAAAL